MKRYSEKDIEFLKKNYNLKTKKELSKILGRTYSSIIDMGQRLSLGRKNINKKENKETRTCTICRCSFPKTKDYFTTFISKRDNEVFQNKCKTCERLYVQDKNSKPLVYLKSLLTGITKSDKRVLRGFDLDLNFITNLYDKQNKLCAITGIEMTTFKGKGLYFSNISIDRINSNMGYLKNNVQLVCFWANQSKGVLSMEEFKNMILMTNNHLNK